MKNNSLEEVIEKLEKSKTVAIFCHVRPDGDALGSGLALYFALKNRGKKAYFCLEEPAPQKFSFLPQIKEAKTGLPDAKFDTMIGVDSASLVRLGAYAKDFSKHKGVTINIDHHITNEAYAGVNYIKERTSSCEIITEILIKAGWEVTEDIANLLMLGLITDSGNFTHPDVTEKTYEIAAYLRGKGADMHFINYNMFGRQPKERAVLYGMVMNKMRFALEDKLAMIIITLDDLQATGADRSLTEGFVDFPLTVDGVEVAASLMEYKKGQYKTSLRSKGKVNVSELATSFGGGGHVLASGCMLFGSLEEVIDKLTYAVYQRL